MRRRRILSHSNLWTGKTTPWRIQWSLNEVKQVSPENLGRDFNEANATFSKMITKACDNTNPVIFGKHNAKNLRSEWNLYTNVHKRISRQSRIRSAVTCFLHRCSISALRFDPYNLFHVYQPTPMFLPLATEVLVMKIRPTKQGTFCKRGQNNIPFLPALYLRAGYLAGWAFSFPGFS